MKWKTLRTHCGECKLIIVVRKNRVVIVCNNVHCVTSHGFRLLWFENYWVSKMTYLGFQKYPQTPSYALHVFNNCFPPVLACMKRSLAYLCYHGQKVYHEMVFPLAFFSVAQNAFLPNWAFRSWMKFHTGRSFIYGIHGVGENDSEHVENTTFMALSWFVEIICAEEIMSVHVWINKAIWIH